MSTKTPSGEAPPRRVLVLCPAFPAEMPLFTQALADTGAEVYGAGEQPIHSFTPRLRDSLHDYCAVRSIFDEDRVVAEVVPWARARGIERVECLWEIGVLLAARIREELGVPGMTVAQTHPFRDKEAMKLRLDHAGIRTPRHRRAATVADCWKAVEEIGYPLIVKPIAGAGSMDTHRVRDDEEMQRALSAVAHVPEVSVEEFVDGEEYTFDTICSGGEILFENICWYRPNALTARTNEWISPQTICFRDLDDPLFAGGRKMGGEVLRALGFETGFTHMEWFRKPDGETVFGEIACRPPGARSVETMALVCDEDIYRAWAEAVRYGRLVHPMIRKYNSAVIFKRAQGRGRITGMEGFDGLRAELGDALVGVDLLPLGSPRRNWKQTLVSDGYLSVRHPDLEELLRLADRAGTDLRIYAG